jgi:HEXXH motif-containing protein
MLANVQRSRHLLLLRGLLDAVGHEAASVARLWDNFQALCDMERENSQQVARLIAHPLVGAWLTATLSRVMGGDRPNHPKPLWADLGHLGAIAVAAAIKSNVQVQAAVPSRRGIVAIPTIGRLSIEDTAMWRMTEVRRLEDGTLTVAYGRRLVVIPEGRSDEGISQLSIRWLRASCEGLTLEVELDDVDPYRNPYTLTTAHRLTGEEVSEWQRYLSEAWTILVTRHWDVAESLARGLRTLVPLRGGGTGWASSTSRHAPAAVALTRPTNGTNLACTLVHEFQHTKLNLIMDVSPLHRGSTRPFFYSPWRDDPRPLTGLLHGIYAGIAMADFWRIEHKANRFRPVTAFEFSRLRRQVEAALRPLVRNDSLTDSGAILVDVMAEVASSWDDDADVSTPSQALADDLVLAHVLRWKLRNLKPYDSDVVHLAAIWRSGASADLSARESALLNRNNVYSNDTLLHLAYNILQKDISFSGNLQGPFFDIPEVKSSDFHLVSGRYSEAASTYEKEIAKGERRIEVWAGFAVSLRRLFGREARAIISRPELVRAVYEHLAEGDSPMPSPRELAHWLAPVAS